VFKSLKKAFDAEGIMIPFPIRTLDFGIKGGVNLKEEISEMNFPSNSK
jgi:small conductance mechanosensitive channel